MIDNELSFFLTTTSYNINTNVMRHELRLLKQLTFKDA